MQICAVAGRGAARVDDDDLGSARRPSGDQPLEQYRVTPCGVATDEDHEIGLVPILVDSRHNIAAECPYLPRYRRSHAKPRIGVDIRAAEEPLHQLVGYVIVLGQELPGAIEGDRARAVLCDRFRKSARHEIKRGFPPDIYSIDTRHQQPSAIIQRFAQGRPL